MRRRFVAVLIVAVLSVLVAETAGRVWTRLRLERWHPLTQPEFNLPVRSSESFGWEYEPGRSTVSNHPIPGIRWNINGAGLRETEEIPYERAPGDPFRILVLGDSFTAGDGSQEEHRWTEVLGRDLGSDVQIINAGVSAYAADQMLLWLQHEGVRYQPDLTLLAHLEENICRIGLPYFIRWPRQGKPSFVLENEKLASLTSDELTRLRIRLGHSTVLGYVLERGFLGPLIGSPFLHSERYTDFGHNVPLLTALVVAAREVARAHGSEFALLYLGMPHTRNFEARRSLQRASIGPLRARGIRVTSFLEPFLRGLSARELRAVQIDGDPHWSRAGHRRFARLVAPVVRNLIELTKRSREGRRQSRDLPRGSGGPGQSDEPDEPDRSRSGSSNR